MASSNKCGSSQQKRRGSVLADQWMDFAEKGFDADEYAESFFLTHTEAEADDRCTELTNLRYHTQDLLRQKVSSHYQLFMRGTEDIQHVEQDIAQLRKLVSRMQESLKMLDGASAAILGLNIQKDKLTPPHRPSSVSFDHAPLGSRPGSRSIFASSSSSSSQSTSIDVARLPKWVQAAPEELERLVVEKQRSQAVALIEKVQSFFAKNSGAASDSEILSLVNKKADDVAEKIIQDLEGMARTILYDFRDMSKQLKMLIILGKPSTAVSFFIRNRGSIMERSLRLLEAGGDPLSYVTLLSEKFFDLLTGACSAFDGLFNVEGQMEMAQSFSRLVIWVDSEVRRYATLVGRQLSATRRDLLENHPVIMKDKDHATYGHPLPPSPLDISTSAGVGATPLPPHSPRASVLVSPQDYLSASRSSQLSKMASMSPASASRRRAGGLLGGSSASLVYDECFLTIGACLEVSFSLAGKLDKLGLPVKPTLARVLSDDLQDLLVGYARSICTRTEKEAEGEESNPLAVPAADLVLRLASSFGGVDGDDEEDTPPPPPPPQASRQQQQKPPQHQKQPTPSSPSPSQKPLRPQQPDMPKGKATVLRSAVSLISELNSLVANFIVLKAPKEAQSDYSTDLSLLDPILIREIYTILLAYPTSLDKRWSAVRTKKRPAANDMKDLGVVGDTIEAVMEVTLVMMDGWLDDPVLLVDAEEMREKLEEVKRRYAQAAAGYSTGADNNMNKPVPAAAGGGKSPVKSAAMGGDKIVQQQPQAPPPRATTPTGGFKRGLLG